VKAYRAPVGTCGTGASPRLLRVASGFSSSAGPLNEEGLVLDMRTLGQLDARPPPKNPKKKKKTIRSVWVAIWRDVLQPSAGEPRICAAPRCVRYGALQRPATAGRGGDGAWVAPRGTAPVPGSEPQRARRGGRRCPWE